MEHERSEHCVVRSEDAKTFAESILIANGLDVEAASLVADCLVAADLRGVDSHGLNRLPSYIDRIRKGVLDPHVNPAIKMVTPVVAHVDARNAFGAIAAHAAMSKAIGIARQFGIGLASVKHSNHFGMSAWVVQQAVDAGFMCLVFTNSSPAMPAWGSSEKLLGVSPIACGAPAGKEPPFILDMAPSVVARGKIHKALRRGEKIPRDWAIDAEGQSTDDPEAALKGVMLPMGGPKGSGLAIMMDVFSGVLSGAAYAGHVTGPYDASKPADVGHFIVVLRPDLFMALDDFKARMDYLYRRVTESKPSPGVDRVFFPGEIEQITHAERFALGIPYSLTEVEALNREAERVGCNHVIFRMTGSTDTP